MKKNFVIGLRIFTYLSTFSVCLMLMSTLIVKPDATDPLLLAVCGIALVIVIFDQLYSVLPARTKTENDELTD